MPIRILELRSALGSGGGPEKTILLGAAQSDSERYSVIVTYVRDRRDKAFDLDRRAAELGVEFVPVEERNSFDLSVLFKLYRVITDKKIDIVHAHDYKTDFFALVLCPLTGAVPLSTSHGWVGNAVKERFYQRLDKWLLRRFPIAVAVSERIRSEIIANGAEPSRVRVIHNGVDTHIYSADPGVRRRLRNEENIPLDATVVGAVGRLSDEKRFDLLIEATASLGCHAVLVGEGPARAALEEKALHLGLGDRIKFLGQRQDARDCHQIFDVYLQSSDTEGIPNAVLEAMALEIPVVATHVGGTSEILDHGVHGLLVPPGDASKMATAIQSTISDQRATRSRVASARERTVSELSFERRMRRLESIYDELFERFPRR